MFSAIAFAVGIGVGLFYFFKGLRIYKQYRVLADTPESTIRSIAVGFVEVHGKGQARPRPAREQPRDPHTVPFL